VQDALGEYVIEVPHAPDECAAAGVAAAAERQGARLAFRGCADGTHTTWIVAELANEEEAWSLVPSLLRDTARVTRVDRCPSASTRRPRLERSLR
jgi:hypothetical protein